MIELDKSCFTQIGLVELELWKFLYKCLKRRKKKEKSRKKKEEDLEFALIDRRALRVAPVKMSTSNSFLLWGKVGVWYKKRKLL